MSGKVFVVAALSLIPLVPGHLSNRTYRLSFLGTTCSSLFSLYSLYGGGVVLLYASKYDDVKLVVNISGRYDLKTGVEDKLGKDYMERIKKDGFIDVKNRSVSFNYRVAEESLMDRLAQQGKLSENDSRRYFQQLIDDVAHWKRTLL
ncbi:hypothetical protein DS421_16g545650 [Arachis hypogaea]|nr:hypothetical protein DS421_16g545650 [Arachis hypogaea]